MIVKRGKDLARRWVVEEASGLPGFLGAYYAGSVNWLPDDATLPSTSDLDVVVVLDGSEAPDKAGKFIYRGVLLEVSYIQSEWFPTAESILGHYHMAGGFKAQSIILDPSGRLGELRAAVSSEFAERRWVRKRCEHAMDNIMRFLRTLDESRPFHDQVTAWLFAASVTTHVPLTAGLKNPTVRRRYMAARELLEEYGRLDFYESLLELLGCHRMSRARAGHHLSALADAFDAAKEVVETPFFFASDISDIARPVAIEGSRELIEGGNHREAVFWMAATYSRCQGILHHDAPPEMKDGFSPGYKLLLADLGIASSADLRRRGEEIEEFLPRLWKVAEEIMETNRDIRD